MKIPFYIPAILGAVCIGCGSNSGEATASGSPAPGAMPSSSAAPTATTASFTSVQQVFTARCGCHGATRPKAGIDLSSYETIMKGGNEGAVIKPGDAEGSPLVQALHGTNGKKKMPPKGELPADQVKAITDWIQAGAKNG